MGILYLDLSDYNSTLDYLNSGKKLADTREKEKKILKPLRLAYLGINDTVNATLIYNQLKSVDPDFDKKRETISADDAKIQELIRLAIEQVKLNEHQKALNILISANEIKETVQANKMIGSILFLLKDNRAYGYYQKAYLSSPNDPEILNNLFLLSLMGNDVGQARFYLDKLKYVSFDFKKMQNLEKLFENKINELKKK
jgi:hypothetical protein